MINEHFLLEEIKTDRWNIQQLVNRIPFATSLGEKRSIEANIKVCVKQIHNTKILLENKYCD